MFQAQPSRRRARADRKPVADVDPRRQSRRNGPSDRVLDPTRDRRKGRDESADPRKGGRGGGRGGGSGAGGGQKPPARTPAGRPRKGAGRPLLPFALGLALGYGLSGPLPKLVGPALAGMFHGPTNLTSLVPPLWLGQGRILVLGTDKVAANTDVMLSVQLGQGKTTLTQVPRDTFIESDRYGVLKANALYATGGIEAVKSELGRLLGSPPDHYVIVNLDAVQHAADAIGGVEVNVPKRMAYVDRTQGLVIDLYPGLQVLRGNDLEGFLRFRHDELGDIGRMERQKLVFNALFRKLADPRTLARLPELLAVAGRDIKTDLSPVDLARLFTAMAGTKLTMERVPGRPFWHHDLSYWMPDSNTVHAGESGELSTP